MIEKNKKLSSELSNKMNIIKEFGYNLNPGSIIMDFGCGSSKMVKELNDFGFQAFCLHYFPSRSRPVERQLIVPLASIIQSHSWLLFWTI